jgi:hypothetical protein
MAAKDYGSAEMAEGVAGCPLVPRYGHHLNT